MKHKILKPFFKFQGFNCVITVRDKKWFIYLTIYQIVFYEFVLKFQALDVIICIAFWFIIIGWNLKVKIFRYDYNQLPLTLTIFLLL